MALTGPQQLTGFPSSPDEWRGHFLEINPIKWIESVSPRPLLILHGDNDEVVEVGHAQALFDRSKEPKKLVLVPGGEHRLRVNGMAMETALTWLKELPAEAK